nr:glycosyltransferase [Magnetospirillum sulfuroxidans]
MPLPNGDGTLNRWHARHSAVSVLEDGRRLGPGHAGRDPVRAMGQGRFSHWGWWLYFSSSDGTDPRTNGRRYELLYEGPLSQETCAVLDVAVNSLRQKKRPDQATLTDMLLIPDPGQRAYLFHHLALAAQQGGDEDLAGALFLRAWALGWRHPLCRSWLHEWLCRHGQFDEATATLRSAAQALMVDGEDEAAGQAAEIVLDYHRLVYQTYPLRRGSPFQDVLIVDPVSAVLADHRRSVAARPEGGDGRLRLAYILAGENEEAYCSLPEIVVELVEHHDRNRFDVMVISLQPQAEVEARNPFYPALAERLRRVGCPVMFWPPGERGYDCFAAAASVADDIAALGLDHLIYFAQSGWYFLLAALHPAHHQIGMGLGETHLYTSRHMDIATHFTLKPAMDGLCRSAVIPPFMPKGRFILSGAVASRAALGIADDVVLLMSSARPVKYRESMFWQAVQAVMTAHPTVWWGMVGIDETGLWDLAREFGVADDVLARIVALGWRNDHQAVIAAADIFVDTIPNGGGYAINEAMARKIAVVSMDDDYLEQFHERTWRPAMELFPPGHFGVAANDVDAFIERIGQLIENPPLRQELAEDGLRAVEVFHRPDLTATALEAVLEQLSAASACGADHSLGQARS